MFGRNWTSRVNDTVDGSEIRRENHLGYIKPCTGINYISTGAGFLNHQHSLKLTASLHLNMDGWTMFPFGGPAQPGRCKLAVSSGRVHSGNMAMKKSLLECPWYLVNGL